MAVEVFPHGVGCLVFAAADCEGVDESGGTAVFAAQSFDIPGMEACWVFPFGEHLADDVFVNRCLFFHWREP